MGIDVTRLHVGDVVRCHGHKLDVPPSRVVRIEERRDDEWPFFHKFRFWVDSNLPTLRWAVWFGDNAGWELVSCPHKAPDPEPESRVMHIEPM